MSHSEDKISLSKKNKRKVSAFIGHELLYDYLSNSLDEERKRAVEDHVKFSRDAQLDLAKIENGQAYADQLSQTIVSQPVIDQISAPATYLTVLMQKSHFDKWPQGLKWGLEALVVVLVVVSLLIVAPWEKVINFSLNSNDHDVILAEVSKTPQQASLTTDQPEFVDEGLKEGQDVKAPAPPVASKGKAEDSAPATTSSNEQTSGTSADSSKVSTATASPAGILYRGQIAVTNLQVVGPKITDKIIELGGRKAGEVELGWERTENSRYYHVTIPEAKRQELESFLSAYGTLKLNKEKHLRVMPDGIIRLIIIVDEAQK